MIGYRFFIALRCIVFCSTCFLFSSVHAQVSESSELFKTLWIKDSLLFNVGFNTCDISQFESHLSEDFEFYHDKSGITPTKAAFVASIKDGLCKLDYKPRRKLAGRSLQVYPLEKEGVLYGAIQMGIHRFYAIEKDKPEYFTSIAKFTHVWKLEGENWKLLKGLSYDHQTVQTHEKENSIFDDSEEIKKWLDENNIPALGLGVIEVGKLKEVRVFGDRKKNETAPYNTIFNVASLTKPVVSMLTLKLVSMGKWNLDEPLCNYWTDPDVEQDPNHKKLTTRHVLNHQTGFANWRRMRPAGKLTFEFEPGTRSQYSGEGFQYLRLALEKKFNKSLEQLADSLIFKPLHMHDTHFTWDKSMDESRFAAEYDSKGNAYEIIKRTKANAADDLMTTLEDYGKFLMWVMDASDLTSDVFKEMISHKVKIKENQYMGLGWVIYDLVGTGGYALAHSGADKGVNTLVVFLPLTKQGLIIFTNADDGNKVYEKLLLEYLKGAGKEIMSIEMKGS